VSDTFNIQLIDTIVPDWYVLEPNEKFDSLTVWIADTTLAAKENIRMEISYFQLDSVNELYLFKDTLDMSFTEREDDSRRRRRIVRTDDDEEEGPPPVPQFNWETNLSTSGFDLNRDILLAAPQPIRYIDPSAIRIFLAEDTLKTPLNFKFERDSLSLRNFRLSFPWESETTYTLETDSAASVNIYGITSKALSSSFRTRPLDYYGTINLEMTGVEGQVLVQLLQNNDAETVLRESVISEDQTVVFDYLPPEKYKVKVIFDENKNGKWDTGSFQDKYQPM